MSGKWGVIADDVTGACDVGAELRAIGLSVELALGVPEPGSLDGRSDVVVVGLSTRTAPPERAVAHSLAAARALRDAGYDRWYQKYCSTFDSTPAGMIGPVAEALAREGNVAGSAGTPSTPHADRTVYRGHLFVGGRLLSESSLATHPLTPMTDSDLVRLLKPQVVGSVALIDRQTVARGATHILRAVMADSSDHLLFDAIDEEDLDAIAAAFDDLPQSNQRVLGGGAGLITALGRRTVRHHGARRAASVPWVEDGSELLIVGSASERTREQLAAAGGPTFVVHTSRAIESPEQVIVEASESIAMAIGAGRRPVVSAEIGPAAVGRAHVAYGVARPAAAIESVLGRIAHVAVAEQGVRRLLVAGGETSGAVVRALGLRSMQLTRRVDPGVAWGVSAAHAVVGEPHVTILLKSGNFGSTEIFTDAWESFA